MGDFLKDIELVKILWDYMKLNQKLEKCDAILGLGCVDLMVAKVSADLYLKGYSDKIMFSGGFGKKSKKVWNEPEAEKFAKLAMELGVPKEKIWIENKASNTSENFMFIKKLIEENKLPIKSCLVVGRPYVEKRSFAVFQKVMPEYKGIFASENVACEEYFNRYQGEKKREEISVLVGDIQRMKVYAEKGWQVAVAMPEHVWKAYEELVKRGYNQYIIEKFL